MSLQRVLIDGDWREADADGSFTGFNPTNKEPLAEEFPVSSWRDCDSALNAATSAAELLSQMSGERIASFLEAYASRTEARKDELVEMAHAETALPKSPRLADVELPRTTNQIRLAATAAREGSWLSPIIDTKLNIRSCFTSIGPVCVFGPNNFPFAFGSISGGDFAAAIAAGNPVIAKANSSHPGTTRLFAEEAALAAKETNMPPGTVQLLYRTSHENGERLVADPRVGATGYTGSREAGLKLKAAADAAGKPIYLELSSINPVVILPGALDERMEAIADDFTSSCLMGAGQFCTNPGVVILLQDAQTELFISLVKDRFQSAPVGTLLSEGVQRSLSQSLNEIASAGANVVVGNTPGGGNGYSHANTLLLVSGRDFLSQAEKMQSEAFGNSSLFVVADDVGQAAEVIYHLEGNLTGCIYSNTQGSDDACYDTLAPRLQTLVGRILNDKMPTGVAVSPAMNHGGPYPATGHPGYTAVGIPTSIHRFAKLQCYDNVRQHRLPIHLQDKNPNGKLWRSIDGEWTQRNIT